MHTGLFSLFPLHFNLALHTTLQGYHIRFRCLVPNGYKTDQCVIHSRVGLFWCLLLAARRLRYRVTKLSLELSAKGLADSLSRRKSSSMLLQEKDTHQFVLSTINNF